MQTERSKTAAAQGQLARKKILIASFCVGLIAGAAWTAAQAQGEPAGAAAAQPAGAAVVTPQEAPR